MASLRTSILWFFPRSEAKSFKKIYSGNLKNILQCGKSVAKCRQHLRDLFLQASDLMDHNILCLRGYLVEQKRLSSLHTTYLSQIICLPKFTNSMILCNTQNNNCCHLNKHSLLKTSQVQIKKRAISMNTFAARQGKNTYKLLLKNLK